MTCRVAPMIDPSADRAVFRQLADLLRNQIESGELGPGEPLPSELRLAQEYGISRTTVRQAIGQLRTEGLVTVDRPRGTFVRVPEPTELVTLGRGERAGARTPTAAQRRKQPPRAAGAGGRKYGVGGVVPAVVVTAADAAGTVPPADGVRLPRP